jgi:hypothetical protein
MNVEFDISGQVLFGHFEHYALILWNPPFRHEIVPLEFWNRRVLGFVRRGLVSGCVDRLHPWTRVIFFLGNTVPALPLRLGESSQTLQSRDHLLCPESSSQPGFVRPKPSNYVASTLWFPVLCRSSRTQSRPSDSLESLSGPGRFSSGSEM